MILMTDDGDGDDGDADDDDDEDEDEDETAGNPIKKQETHKNLYNTSPVVSTGIADLRNKPV